VSGAVQEPHANTPPQPSDARPQLAPSDAQVAGVQDPVPHVFAPPPPHTSGLVQLPQSKIRPQPSCTSPQVAPASAQLATAGVHWTF
jgi:hypothetical protein